MLACSLPLAIYGAGARLGVRNTLARSDSTIAPRIERRRDPQHETRSTRPAAQTGGCSSIGLVYLDSSVNSSPSCTGSCSSTGAGAAAAGAAGCATGAAGAGAGAAAWGLRRGRQRQRGGQAIAARIRSGARAETGCSRRVEFVPVCTDASCQMAEIDSNEADADSSRHLGACGGAAMPPAPGNPPKPPGEPPKPPGAPGNPPPEVKRSSMLRRSGPMGELRTSEGRPVMCAGSERPVRKKATSCIWNSVLVE
jgi:hypothetical protein